MIAVANEQTVGELGRWNHIRNAESQGKLPTPASQPHLFAKILFNPSYRRLGAARVARMHKLTRIDAYLQGYSCGLIGSLANCRTSNQHAYARAEILNAFGMTKGHFV